MKKWLYVLLSLLLLPVTVGAYTIVYKDNAFRYLLRPGKTVLDYTVDRYAGEVFTPPQGTVLFARQDSIASAWIIAEADSAIIYDADSLAADLDTLTIFTDSIARMIQKRGVTYIDRDSLVLNDGLVIMLR